MKISNDPKEFRDDLLQLLVDDEENRRYVREQSDLLLSSRKQENFYSELLRLFVHLSFEEKDARDHWIKILENYDYLHNCLDRPVGLRVAMFDYFINLNQMLNFPILVEIRLFKRTQEMAMVDSLTGVFNRRYFDVNFLKEVKRARRYHKELSVFFLDLDNFKVINDTRGHLFGDEVLRKLGEELKESCREEDIICRYGGEEFVVVLPETNSGGAQQFADRFRDKLKGIPFFADNQVTFSGGVCTFPYDGDTPEELLRNADQALYAAKFSGKDCIVKSKTDNRRFVRYHESVPIQYKAIEIAENEPMETVDIQDISFGGIRFETVETMRMDSKMLLHIPTPQGEEIVLIGKIVWHKEMPGNVNSYGVQFIDINQEQVKKLEALFPDIEYRRES